MTRRATRRVFPAVQGRVPEESRARLKDLDAEIAKLHEEGRNLRDDAKANWDRKMADLEPKRDAARAKLAEVGRSSAEARNDLQNVCQAADVRVLQRSVIHCLIIRDADIRGK